jgi:hypothetical protein
VAWPLCRIPTKSSNAASCVCVCVWSREQISAGFEFLTELTTNSILLVVWCTRSSATFRENVQPPSSGKWPEGRAFLWGTTALSCCREILRSFVLFASYWLLFLLVNSEDWYSIFLRNVNEFIPDYMVSYSRDIFMFLRKERKIFRLNYKVFPPLSLEFWKGKGDCLNYNCLRSVIYALCISVDCNINLPCFGVARIVCSLQIIFRGAPRPSRYIEDVLNATLRK